MTKTEIKALANYIWNSMRNIDEDDYNYYEKFNALLNEVIYDAKSLEELSVIASEVNHTILVYTDENETPVDVDFCDASLEVDYVDNWEWDGDDIIVGVFLK